jgi:hypothetical protein
MIDLTYKHQDTLFGERYAHFFGTLVMPDIHVKFIDNEELGLDRKIKAKVFSKKQSMINAYINFIFSSGGNACKSVWRTYDADANGGEVLQFGEDILLSTKASTISKNIFESTHEKEFADSLDCDMFTFELNEIVSCLLEKEI